jgi:non-canonical purine NTP pyrophosphatase (RdgB/HAM1 family)
MFNKLKFVTGNPNKVREAGEILGLDLDSVQVDGLFEVQTPDLDEVVRHKAQQAYSILQCPVMVEDSGLVFHAWDGLPGALVKWFEETVGCPGMLKMLSGFEDRAATAICCFAIYDGKTMQIARGEVKGSLADKIRGENGFGWDVIFIPEGYEQTYAEMSAQEKNAISHRKRALDELKQLSKAG